MSSIFISPPGRCEYTFKLCSDIFPGFNHFIGILLTIFFGIYMLQLYILLDTTHRIIFYIGFLVNLKLIYICFNMYTS